MTPVKLETLHLQTIIFQFCGRNRINGDKGLQSKKQIKFSQKKLNNETFFNP